MTTRSVIALPTDTGYTGIYVHFNGLPSNRLPLLLAAYKHRFGGDITAMAQQLIDDVDVGWEELGTDLLDGAPKRFSPRSPEERSGRAGRWTT
ncbi:hypothetical protein [Streptomyces inhibens]|uniref:hypothetical protein n=1 Tax=Streptomyces inhibens TaxID=2293571 RepID=UPI00267C5241